MKELVLWAKAHGITLSSVQVGGVKLELYPPAPSAGAVKLPDVDDSKSTYETYGGELFKQLEAAQAVADVDDDDQPAVQS